MRQVGYGFRKQLKGVPFAEAVTRATEALKTEGFGVLSTIAFSAFMACSCDPLQASGAI